MPNTLKIMKVKMLVTQSCLYESSLHSVITFCNPMDCSPPSSSVHGIQARIPEWVAMTFFRDRPNPGVEPRSPALKADSF